MITNSENPAVKKLWLMSEREFNDWRRKNDLIGLLGFFQSDLPCFGEWQRNFQVTDEVFLSSDAPSRFFCGKEQLYLQRVTGPNSNGVNESKVYFSTMSADDHRETQRRHHGEIRYEIDSSVAFVPYFHWLNTAKSLKEFPIIGDRNRSFATDFSYGLWQAMGTKYSEAFLFKKHKVLKMGSVTVTPWQFDSRNLDFVSLDDLVVTGEGWTHTTKITYSSCNRFSFHGCEKAFVTFEKCYVEEFLVASSRIQDLHFNECTLHRPVFRKSRLFKISFQKTTPDGVDFDDCELSELSFVDPPDNRSPLGLRDIYKRFRVAFQNQGDRAEAAHYYYEERSQQLLSHLNPLIPTGKGFPSIGYRGNLFSLYDLWLQKRIDGKEVLHKLKNNLLCALKILFYPHLLLRFLWIKKALITDSFDWGVWGFGEKPWRVFIWMACVLGVFTALYYWSSVAELRGNVLRSLYCSASNFATIGCEFKSGIDSIEAILGATLLGIMVSGFANRTRY
ncbi:MAG: pentapeptide repeat-containing protein [Elusimicrobia bacterium]|nr:pentapeptide repeat-containing protein [Candidatus Obscuribacterium magneticum]MCB4756378.1 pentapeptide repeat-containing protein [Candidatus Obscuribacterium magneticum]